MTISPSKSKVSDVENGKSATLNTEELRQINAYWRACNYLALGMIYLQDNPLLKEPLKPEHIKNRLLGLQKVALEQMLLKPNMVISGKDCPQQANIAEVAEATVNCLLNVVPTAVQGVAFLSGVYR